ncbi:MAG TPA: hypothetical protein VFM88_12455 [Vicinamibacteria bacterium]|nr:hypothetical protein [Vicinamibacteria bacterium]
MTPRSLSTGLLGLAWAALACDAGAAVPVRPMPPFPGADAAAWIGPPQALDALKGKVVLLDVWTFG